MLQTRRQDNLSSASQVELSLFLMCFSLPFSLVRVDTIGARYSRPLIFLGTSTPSSQSKSALSETAAERTGVRSCSFLPNILKVAKC